MNTDAGSRVYVDTGGLEKEVAMRTSIRTSMLRVLSATALAIAVVGSTDPASAGMRMGGGGGFHGGRFGGGGFGGFHGGGFGGGFGGFHGGGFGGRGFAGRGFFHPGFGFRGRRFG